MVIVNPIMDMNGTTVPKNTGMDMIRPIIITNPIALVSTGLNITTTSLTRRWGLSIIILRMETRMVSATCNRTKDLDRMYARLFDSTYRVQSGTQFHHGTVVACSCWPFDCLKKRLQFEHPTIQLNRVGWLVSGGDETPSQ